VECPTGSGDYMNLLGVAEEIQHRIIHIFGRDSQGRRATNGGNSKVDFDPHFRDYVWFYEASFAQRLLSFSYITLFCSFSMRTVERVWVLLTKRAGLVWLHTIFCRVELAVGCLAPQRVGFSQLD